MIFEDRLTILEIARPYLPITPSMSYGGVEINISNLLKEFSRMGHEVILAAPGDSEFNCKIVPTIPESSWNGLSNRISSKEDVDERHYTRVVDYILSNRTKIDVIHDHPGLGLLHSKAYERYSREIKIPILVTVHDNTDQEKIAEIKRKSLQNGTKVCINGISNFQRRRFSGIEDFVVIYHGIPVEEFEFIGVKNDYLFSLGTICRSKGQHTAIATAKRLGLPLIIGGYVHNDNKEYFDSEIKPHIDNKQIQYIGSLDKREKISFYGHAKAFLMPIEREEAFGLVMIEAMACGTPVVGFDRGSVREVVANNRTGYVVPVSNNPKKDLESFVLATSRVSDILPELCRLRVEKRFTIEREADEYLKIFNYLINEQSFTHLKQSCESFLCSLAS